MKRENDKETAKWIISVLNGQWRWIFFSTALSSISVISGVIMTLFLRDMINAAVAKNAQEMWAQFAVFATLIGMQYLLSYINRRVVGAAQIRFTAKMKQRIMEKLFKKDFSAVRAYHSGELMNRITADVDVVASIAMSLVPNVVSMVVRILAAGIVLSFLSWELILLLVGFAVIMCLCMLLFRGPLKRLQRRVREAVGKTRGFMQETLINLPVVKAFSASEIFSDKLRDYQDNTIRAKLKHLRFSALAHIGLGVAFALVYVIALGWGGYALIYIDGFDYGTLTAVLQLVSQVRSPLAGMTEVMPRIYSMLVSAERLMELETLEDEVSEKTDDTVYNCAEFSRLTAKDLCFRYQDNEPVLENLSLSVNRGELVALSGRSGIGKSTLMKLLLALYKPSAGELILECADGNQYPVSPRTRRFFSYVPQGNLLFAGTIRDNVTLFAGGKSDEQVIAALKLACLDDFVETLENGLDTLLMEDGAGVSEGQAQRIAVARALLYDAPVLLLDEATSALDEATEIRLLTNIKESGRTCFIISHRSSVNELAAHRLVMRDDEIEIA
ncbi:MAG: ABC transporter ATP-binding protein [Clostridia bacterium]|nr:ABC transporter ATP-binding protein [Clostridia bacterium]